MKVNQVQCMKFAERVQEILRDKQAAARGVRGGRNKPKLKPKVAPAAPPAPSKPSVWKEHPFRTPALAALGLGTTGALGYGVTSDVLEERNIEKNHGIEEVLKKPETQVPATAPTTDADNQALAWGAGGGALTGALGSLLYGKLKGKADVRRDLVAALLGAAGGAGIAMYRKS